MITAVGITRVGEESRRLIRIGMLGADDRLIVRIVSIIDELVIDRLVVGVQGECFGYPLRYAFGIVSVPHVGVRVRSENFLTDSEPTLTIPPLVGVDVHASGVIVRDSYRVPELALPSLAPHVESRRWETRRVGVRPAGRRQSGTLGI